MSKVIAFYGSPGSGKTTVALKCAMEIYVSSKDGSRIAYVSPDVNVPAIGLLFPNYDPDDVHTLSAVLEKTDITPDSLLAEAITFKNMKDFVCFGFKTGETKYSFPEPTDDKVNRFYDALQDIADYVFVDCTTNADDKISRKAFDKSDVLIRVISPDIKGVTWFKSDTVGNRIENKNFFNVINQTDNTEYFPTEEVSVLLNSIGASLPYCQKLKGQMLRGEMSDMHTSTAYKKRMLKLIEKITQEKTNG